MTVRVDIGQRPGSSDQPTRDRVVVLDNAAVLLGGTGNADVLAEELTRCLRRPVDLPLADAVRGIGIPGEAAVLVCRWTDDTVEVLTLGGCTAIVYTRDGPAHRVHDDRADDAVVRGWPRAGVDAVLLLTDGVADLVDRHAVNGFPHWHDVFELVAADGVQALVDHAHAVEDNGADARRQARGKAAVLVRTETYDLRTRLEPPYSTLAVADRARERGDFTAAIEMYSSAAEQARSEQARSEQARSGPDLRDARDHARFGRMDSLARAGRLDELAALAKTDKVARRRLDRQLHDDGRADELRARAAGGDKTALYLLIRLLRTRDDGSARRAVEAIAPDDDYARQLADEPRT